MNELFELPVTANGKDLLFPARLLQLGYTHKFEVDVYGTQVFFEPDEEGAYRAVVDPDERPKHFDPELLQAIAAAIDEVLR